MAPGLTRVQEYGLAGVRSTASVVECESSPLGTVNELYIE